MGAGMYCIPSAPALPALHTARHSLALLWHHPPGLPLPPAPCPCPHAGYDQGNLNWLAAFEVEPASDVMALRVWKSEQLTPLEAQVRAPQLTCRGCYAGAAMQGLGRGWGSPGVCLQQ